MGAEFVMACVGNDQDLRARSALGPDGAFYRHDQGRGLRRPHHGLGPDHPRTGRRVAAALDLGISSTPLFPAARPGPRTVPAFHHVRRARVEDYASRRARHGRLCPHLPPDWATAGAGQLAKMMNQICIAGLMQGLSEALAFGQKAGLGRREAVVEVISQGAAGSWQMVNRHKTMLADTFDFGFAVDWMRKDLEASAWKPPTRSARALPVTALVDQFYKDVQLMGGGRNDTSSLIRRLR